MESCKNGFAFALSENDRELFMEMIEKWNKYADAMNVKSEPVTRVDIYCINTRTTEND